MRNALARNPRHDEPANRRGAVAAQRRARGAVPPVHAVDRDGDGYAPRRARPRSRGRFSVAIALAQILSGLAFCLMFPVRLWLARFVRRPVDTLGATLLVTLVLAVLLNSLVLQKAHHPAPLFRASTSTNASANAARSESSIAVRESRAVVPPAVPPAPVTAPRGLDKNGLNQMLVPPPPASADRATSADRIGALLAANPAEGAGQGTSGQGSAGSGTLAAQADPVGRFLQAESSAATKATFSVPAPQAASRERIIAVQKAFVKIGLIPQTSKIDGVMGNETRQSIEHFERQNKWPITGILSPRLVKRLASVSAVAIP